jgi:hypothetical protein
MKNLRSLCLLGFAATALLVGCSKGDAGPAGPAGPAGAAGATGANGANGTNGSDSVMYSAWMPMNMSDTIEGTADTTYYQNFTANALTSAILNTGTVITYLETIDGNNDSLFFNASTVLTESYYVGDIFVESFPPQATNSAGFNWAGYNYRFIIIPGDIAATMFKGMTQQQIRTISYPTFNKLAKAAVTTSAGPQVSTH